jgi:hypothetical protein
MKRLISAFILLGFRKKKKRKGTINRNKETWIKGNLIIESRGHRVKRKKESAVKELLKINNFILGKLLKA